MNIICISLNNIKYDPARQDCTICICICMYIYIYINIITYIMRLQSVSNSLGGEDVIQFIPCPPMDILEMTYIFFPARRYRWRHWFFNCSIRERCQIAELDPNFVKNRLLLCPGFRCRAHWKWCMARMVCCGKIQKTDPRAPLVVFDAAPGGTLRNDIQQNVFVSYTNMVSLNPLFHRFPD